MEPPSEMANDSVVEYEILDEHGNQIMINGAEQLKQLAACVNEVRQSDGSVIKEYILNDPKIIEQIRSQIKTLSNNNGNINTNSNNNNNLNNVSYTPPLPTPNNSTDNGHLNKMHSNNINGNINNNNSNNNGGYQMNHLNNKSQNNTNANTNNNMKGPNSGSNLTPSNSNASKQPLANGIVEREIIRHRNLNNNNNKPNGETKSLEPSSSSHSLNNNNNSGHVSQVQQQIQKFQKQQQQQQQQSNTGTRKNSSNDSTTMTTTGIVSKFAETFNNQTNDTVKSRFHSANNSNSNSNGNSNLMKTSHINSATITKNNTHLNVPGRNKFELKTSKGKSLQFTITSGDPSESDIEEVNSMLSRRNNLFPNGNNSKETYKEANFFNNGLRALVVTPNNSTTPTPSHAQNAYGGAGLSNSKSTSNLSTTSNMNKIKQNQQLQKEPFQSSKESMASGGGPTLSSSFQPRSASNYHSHHPNQTDNMNNLLSKSGSISNMLGQSTSGQQSSSSGFGHHNHGIPTVNQSKFNSISSHNISNVGLSNQNTSTTNRNNMGQTFYASPYHFEHNKSQPNLTQLNDINSVSSNMFFNAVHLNRNQHQNNNSSNSNANKNCGENSLYSNMASNSGNLMPVNENESVFNYNSPISNNNHLTYNASNINNNNFNNDIKSNINSTYGRNSTATLKRSSSFGNSNYLSQSAAQNAPQFAHGYSSNANGYLVEDGQYQTPHGNLNGTMTKSTMNLSYQANNSHHQQISGNYGSVNSSTITQQMLSKHLYSVNDPNSPNPSNSNILNLEEAAKNLSNMDVTPEMTEKLLLKLLLQQITSQKNNLPPHPGLPSAAQLLQQLQLLQQQQQSHKHNQQQQQHLQHTAKWQQFQQQMSQHMSSTGKQSYENYTPEHSGSPLPPPATALSSSSSSSTTGNQQLNSSHNNNNNIDQNNARHTNNNANISTNVSNSNKPNTNSTYSITNKSNLNHQQSLNTSSPCNSNSNSQSTLTTGTSATKSNVNQIKNKLFQKSNFLNGSQNNLNTVGHSDNDAKPISRPKFNIDSTSPTLKNIKQQLQKHQQQQQSSPVNQMSQRNQLEKSALKTKNVSFTSR